MQLLVKRHELERIMCGGGLEEVRGVRWGSRDDHISLYTCMKFSNNSFKK